MNDDATLLQRYSDEGSETAFTELVRRHADLVYGAALRRTGENRRAVAGGANGPGESGTEKAAAAGDQERHAG